MVAIGPSAAKRQSDTVKEHLPEVKSQNHRKTKHVQQHESACLRTGSIIHHGKQMAVCMGLPEVDGKRICVLRPVLAAGPDVDGEDFMSLQEACKCLVRRALQLPHITIERARVADCRVQHDTVKATTPCLAETLCRRTKRADHSP